jgi:hypothetical protein
MKKSLHFETAETAMSFGVTTYPYIYSYIHIFGNLDLQLRTVSWHISA